MCVNKYNSEGYFDPTAYEALATVERERKKARAYRPIVYICSPLSGEVEKNSAKARRYCRFAVDSGCVPLAPHLFFPQFMSDKDKSERALALFMDIVLLSKCAELWVFGNKVSSGMSKEISQAKKKKMTIRYFTDGCKEVFK